MNKELERRVELAAKHLLGDANPDAVDVARDILAAAFPELFSDPPAAWLAPMEPTKAMMRALFMPGMADAWAKWRDAHLNTTGSSIMHDGQDE